MEFELEGQEFITLQALLKFSGLCETGGHAKGAIKEGEVLVDGEVETRRGKKTRNGQVITFEGTQIKVCP